MGDRSIVLLEEVKSYLEDFSDEDKLGIIGDLIGDLQDYYKEIEEEFFT